MNKPVFENAIGEEIQLDNLGSIDAAENLVERMVDEIGVPAEEDKARRVPLLDLEASDQNRGRSNHIKPDIEDKAAAGLGQVEEQGSGNVSSPLVTAVSRAASHSIDAPDAGAADAVKSQHVSPEKAGWDAKALPDSAMGHSTAEAVASRTSVEDHSSYPAQDSSSVILTDGALFATPSTSASRSSTNAPVETLAKPPASGGIFVGPTTIDENPGLIVLGTLEWPDDGFAHKFATIAGQPIKVIQGSDGKYKVAVTDPSVFNYETATNHQVQGLIESTTYDIETGASTTISQTLTFRLQDVVENPTNLVLTSNNTSIGEHPNNVLIGTMTGVDPEGYGLTWSIIGDSRLFFVGNKLYATGEFDYEAGPHQIAVTVQAKNKNPSDIPRTANYQFTLTVNDSPDAPTGINLTYPDGIGVPEESKGIKVATLSGIDPDAAPTTFTYRIVDSQFVPFKYTDWYEIKNVNELWLKPGVKLDFEGGNAWPYNTISIEVTDGTGLSQLVGLTVNIENVKENPHDISLALDTGSVAENSRDQRVGILSVMDDTADQPNLIFSIDPDVGGKYFTVVKEQQGPNSWAWVLRTRPDANIDYESLVANNYKIPVKITVFDPVSLYTTLPQTFDITITDVNESPYALVVHEPVATVRVGDLANKVIVDADAVDPDANPAFQDNVYKFLLSNGTLSDTSQDGFFTVDATGKVKLVANVTAAQLGSNHSFTVVTYKAGDPTNYVSSQQYTVTVQNAGTPGDIKLTGAPVAENGSAGVVGTLSASDPDSTITGFTLVNTDGPFTLQKQGTNWVVAATGGLNYEAAPHSDATGRWYEVTVTAQSADNQTSPQQVVRVYVTDVNEAPDLSTANATVSIGEFARNGDTLATFSLVDPDLNEQFVYTITGVPSWAQGAFGVDAVNKKIIVIDQTKLAVAKNETFTLTLTVQDKNGNAVLGSLSDSQDFTVTIVDGQGNLPPSNIHLDGDVKDTAAESMQPGDVVGTLSANDENPAGVTYAFATGFNGAGHFVIDNATKQIKVAQALNFEDPITTTPGAGLEQDGSGRFYRLKLIATDDGNQSSAAEEIKVYVTDVNEAPDLSTANPTVSIDEFARNGDTLATFSLVDPDLNEQFVYTITGVPSWAQGAFGVDAVNKKIIVIDQTKLEVLKNETFTLTLTVQDKNGNAVLGSLSDSQDFTVTINNLNNAPTFRIDGPTSFRTAAVGGMPKVFGGIELKDDETNDEVTFTVAFEHDAGTLNYFGGGVSASGPELKDGKDVYTFTGTATALTAFLDNMTFNPKDRASGEPDLPTKFTFTVKDNFHPASTYTDAIEVVSVTTDAPPTFDVNGRTSFKTLAIGGETKPFGDIVLNDDTPNGLLNLTIAFADDGESALGGLVSASGVTVSDPVTINGQRTYTFTGTASALNAYLDNVTFNPKDRASGEPDVSIKFSFTLKDALHEASAYGNRIEVISVATDTDAPPTLQVNGETEFVTKAVGGEAKAFAGVELNDVTITDVLTLKIAYDVGAGFLTLPENWSSVKAEGPHEESGKLIYTFTGTAGALSSYLDQVGFDPTDQLTGSPDVTTSFTFLLKDELHNEVAYPDRITVVSKAVDNLGPDDITLLGDTITENVGKGVTVGVLQIHDLEGDAIQAVSMEDNSFFTVRQDDFGNWLVEVNGEINWEALPRLPDGRGWIDVKVKAQDIHGEWGPEQILRVYVNDDMADPENLPPEISVGQKSWLIADTDTVAPFEFVSFSDPEEGDTGMLYVQINFDPAKGEMIPPDLSKFTNLTIWQVPWGDPTAPEYSPGTLFITGVKADVDALIQSLAFDPKNRPQDHDGPNADQITDFQIVLFDSTFNSPAIAHVTVDATASGNTTNNSAPVITVGQKEWTTTDWAVVFPKPFGDVNIQDSDGNLTLKISFHKGDGAFIIPQGEPFSTEDSADGTTVTYIFQGDAAHLNGLLSVLEFDAANRDAASPIPIETKFTISVDDGHHAFPTTNEEVKVVTTVTGNTAATLSIADGTETTDATDNGLAVFPFRGLDVADAENDDLMLTISFAAVAGVLGGASVAGKLSPDGQTITYTFTDKADALDALLHGLTFDPQVPGDTSFQITVTDNRPGHTPASGQVVVQTVSGNDSANTAPTMVIADHSTDASDNGPAVLPFLTVDLDDKDGDSLTLTISFKDSDGTLSGAPNNYHGSLSGNVRTFVFTGSADALDAILHSLSFDPSQDLAKNGQVTTAFSIAVQDSKHPAVTDSVNVVTQHGNGSEQGAGNDPLAITLTPNFVDEGLPNHDVGVLATIDPDVGDTFSYTLVRSDGTEDATDGRFALVTVGNQVFLKTVGALDWENTSQDPLLKEDYFGRYYEVKVKTTDSLGHSLVKTLNVYVHDVADDPSNAGPSILGADSDVFAPVGDNHVVSPFGNITFWDPDSANITVTIALDNASEGYFEGTRLGGGHYDPVTGIYTVSGTVSQVQDAVQGLQFHAADRPNDPLGTEITTDFAITVSDGNSSARNTHIHVKSTAVDDGDDQTPTVSGLGTVNADANNGTVAPFGSVTIGNDPGQATTAMITFQKDLGALSGTGLVLVTTDDGDGNAVYTVTGTDAANLQSLLAGLTFDPRDLAVAGTSEDIAFHVTVTDVNHPTSTPSTAIVHSLGPVPDLLENKTVLENSAEGAAVGRLMDFNAATGETFTYTLAAGGDAGGRFTLDGNVLRVADGHLLDFEQQRLWDVKLLVTSNLRGALPEQTLHISLRNSDDEFIDDNDGSHMFVTGAVSDGLFGHGGNDTLVSGEGFDELWGGDGADAFVIDVYAEDGSSLDMIMDFNGTEDRIELSTDYFFTLGLGKLDSTAFYVLGHGQQTDQHQIIYNDTTGELFYDMDGSNPDAAPILIATLQDGSGGVPILTADNIRVVNNYWTA